MGFPATAPNASHLPYALRLKGWPLVGVIAGSAVGMLIGPVLALSVSQGQVPKSAFQLLIYLGGACFAAFCGLRLLRLKDPEVELFPDRLVRPGLMSPRVLYRTDILGVSRTFTNRSGSYFYVVPHPGRGDRITFPGSLRKDTIFADWLSGAPDPAVLAREADRASVLADYRYGDDARQRALRLEVAKRLVIGITIVCAALALWLGFIDTPKALALGVAGGCLVAGYILVSASQGLVVWLTSGGVRPTALATVVPAVALSLRGMLTVHLLAPDPLVISAVVVGMGAALLTMQLERTSTPRLQFALSVGFAAALFSYGAGAYLDSFSTASPSRSFVVTAVDKHVNHGRSTSYHVDLAPWGDQPARSVGVSSQFYDQVEVGGNVCVDRYRGDLRLPWFNLGLCKNPGLRTRDQHLGAGTALLNAGRYADAAQEFDQAAAQDPGSDLAWANAAISRTWAGDLGGAKAEVGKALRYNPENSSAIAVQGMIALRLGKPPEALAAFNRALRLNPDNSFILEQRAAVEMTQRSYTAAIKDLDAVLAAHPKDPWALVTEGTAYLATRRPGEVKRFAAGIGVDAKDQALLFARAQLMLMVGDRVAAMDAADRAVGLHPTANAYDARARLRAAWDLAGARKDAEAALRLDPNSASAAQTLAWLYGREERYAEASKILDSLVSDHPDAINLAFTRVEYLFKAGRTGDLPPALASIRARVIHDPERLNALCWDQAVMGIELEQALADCDASLRISPGTAHVLDSRAFVLLRLGRDQDAVDAYTATLARDPKLALSQYGRSIAEARLGRSADATSDATAAKALDPKVSDQFASLLTQTHKKHGGD